MEEEEEEEEEEDVDGQTNKDVEHENTKTTRDQWKHLTTFSLHWSATRSRWTENDKQNIAGESALKRAFYSPIKSTKELRTSQQKKARNNKMTTGKPNTVSFQFNNFVKIKINKVDKVHCTKAHFLVKPAAHLRKELSKLPGEAVCSAVASRVRGNCGEKLASRGREDEIKHVWYFWPRETNSSMCAAIVRIELSLV